MNLRRLAAGRLLALLIPLAVSGGCVIEGGWDDDDDEASNLSGNDSDFGGAQPVGPSCAVGAPGCACTQTGVCDEGLTCVDSIDTCVLPSSCPVGAPGCVCTEGGSCDPGLACKENYCVSEDPCLPAQAGTESCQCTQGGACDPGLQCLSAVCVDTSSVTTDGGSTSGPEDPQAPESTGAETSEDSNADSSTSG